MNLIRASQPIFIFVAASVLSTPASQAAEAKLAAMPLVAKRVPAATVEILDDLLVNEVGQKSGMIVIGAQDINAILGLDKMKDALGCSDVSCAAQIGGALGVDFLLTGSVSTLGGEVIVSLTLIDTKQTQPKARGQIHVADDERFFAYAIAASVAQIFNLPPPTPPSAPPPAAKPENRSQGGLYIGTSNLDSVNVAIRSLVDGQSHACTKAVTAGKPCFINGIPAGPITVDFTNFDGTQSLTHKLDILGGDSGRTLTISKSEPQKVLKFVGPALALVGPVVALVGFNMKESTPARDPDPRLFTMVTGGAATIVGLVFTGIGYLSGVDYAVADSEKKQM